MRVLRPSHPDLRSLRSSHNPSYQGHKLWNATWLLLSYLEREPPKPDSRILEAGCGWGLSSIYCASVCGAEVTAVDVDEEVFPFLRLHARHNNVNIRTLTAGFDEVPGELLRRQDLIIGADICFRAAMIEPLFSLLERALAAGAGKIALSDPGRLAFRSLAAKCVRDLGGVEMAWQVEEPLIQWHGSPLIVHGHIVTIE